MAPRTAFLALSLSLAAGAGAQTAWVTLYATGSFGNEQKGKDAFNDEARKSDNGIIRRECEDCPATHRDIYFRRKRDPELHDYWADLMVNWRGDVRFHLDFDIYSNLGDAEFDTNAWQFCNGNDPGIGFPRDCGPVSSVPYTWNSFTNSASRKNYKFSAKRGPVVTLAGSFGFDGSTSFVRLPRPIQDDFTIVLEFKTTDSRGGCSNPHWWCGRGLVDADVTHAANDFGLSIDRGYVMFGVGAPDVTIRSTITYDDNQWHKVHAIACANACSLSKTGSCSCWIACVNSGAYDVVFDRVHAPVHLNGSTRMQGDCTC